MMYFNQDTFYILILFINAGTLLYLLFGIDEKTIGVGWTLVSSFTGMLVIFLLSEILI